MSNRSFDYFVIFAEMRTGSNLLEASLNAYQGLLCHGEAFNPSFIGYPNKTEILGITDQARDLDPLSLIEAIKHTPGTLSGFRFFHDHDQRVLETILTDPRCAKIILTRNPVDSYVSQKIARLTGQWKLTNVKKAKTSKVTFDAKEFTHYVRDLQGFQTELLHALQTTGQTAFYIGYDDLQDLDVINGLARFLGSSEQLKTVDTNLKKQNPSPHSEKVENFEEMQTSLSGFDLFNLSKTPNFEPRKEISVENYVLAPTSRLLFLPMPGGPTEAVCDWIAAIDGVDREALAPATDEKSLRRWIRANKGFRSFTVLRHPLLRAHNAYCNMVIDRRRAAFEPVRRSLETTYDVTLPQTINDTAYDDAAHRKGFEAFLQFVKANLSGLTQLRPFPLWASQNNLLENVSKIATPDYVFREEDMLTELAFLSLQMGQLDAPDLERPMPGHSERLIRIQDADLDRLIVDVYRRDFERLGYDRWVAPQA